MRNLPPAVQQTVKEQSKGAKVRGLSKELEQGKTVYELETISNGQTRDLLIDADGKVIEIEEQMALTALPPAVKDAIVKQAGKGRIVRVEAVTKDGKLEFYEAQVRRLGKLGEIKVSPEGQPIAK
ncbi:MAG: hypothetical protein HYR56_20860 [Acidobacteria bacterium]|nr:hypothetical protein [Acidobacteriota bacterium]MBI3425111.1 hypothetical protein [Acidobacteriota bacterium]